MKHTAKHIILPSAPISESEALSTNKIRTYSIKIELDAPYPSPKTATTRSIDGRFVWERLVTRNGRAEAVALAGEWFQSLRKSGRKGGVGKVLVGKLTHECVTVDDNWNECLYGSNFNPKDSCNRLLDKETIQRVMDESKGNLKIADSPVIKGQGYPSLEWATCKKINSLPIKIGFSSYSEPAKGGMKESLAKAVKKAKKRKMPWAREMELKEAKATIRRMKAKGFLQSREKYMNDLIERTSNSKRAKESKA